MSIEPSLPSRPINQRHEKDSSQFLRAQSMKPMSSEDNRLANFPIISI
jgi:hypothetical protein